MNVLQWIHDGDKSQVLIKTSPAELREIADAMEVEGKMLQIGAPDWCIARMATDDRRIVLSWDWKKEKQVA